MCGVAPIYQRAPLGHAFAPCVPFCTLVKPRGAVVAARVANLLGGNSEASKHIVDVALDPARSIAVLSSRVPFRAKEAAEIYREGWAPGVRLLNDQRDVADEACASTGIHHITLQEYDRMVLEGLGIPMGAVRNLETPTTSTLSNLYAKPNSPGLIIPNLETDSRAALHFSESRGAPD